MLQIFHAQRDSLLAYLGSMESSSLLAKFNMSYVKILLSYHVSLSINVVHGRKTIRFTVVDEATSMCVILMSYWKDLGSLDLVPSNT